MSFRITTATGTTAYDADEHRVEGSWHVLRRTTLVMGQPRTVVALRLPVADVLAVTPVDPGAGVSPPGPRRSGAAGR